MAWKRFRHRQHKVWVRVDPAERPVLDERGLAAMRYKPEDERTYTARAADLAPLDPPEPLRPEADARPVVVQVALVAPREGAPAGFAARLAWGEHVRTLGAALITDDLEAAAVEALGVLHDALKRHDLPVHLVATEARRAVWSWALNSHDAMRAVTTVVDGSVPADLGEEALRQARSGS